MTVRSRPVDGPRVAVAGAGLGGLCLAQGLLRAGIDVQVYERDPALDARRQGYRLHMDARAGLALEKCLPPQLFRLFLATTGRPGARVTVLSARLRVLHQTPGRPNPDPDDPATLSTSVDRGVLREILATGLDDRIHYGRELVTYTQDAGGVTLRFADGSTEAAGIPTCVACWPRRRSPRPSPSASAPASACPPGPRPG